MPVWRNPVSAWVRAFMPSHSRNDSTASGTSARSRPILRHQPQLRLDCSPAILPFSQSATDTPFSARKSAVEAPTMPPPMTTTSASAGSSEVVWTGSIAMQENDVGVEQIEDKKPDTGPADG